MGPVLERSTQRLLEQPIDTGQKSGERLAGSCRCGNEDILIRSDRRPLFRGIDQPNGCDYLCGGCRSSVLAENILPGQLLDFTLCCLACASPNFTPQRLPGVPICDDAQPL